MLKLKAANAPSPRVPFSWDNLPSTPPLTGGGDPPTSPPTVWLESPKYMKIFGSSPLKPEVSVVKCPDCDKPVLESVLAYHSEKCREHRMGKKGKAGVDLKGKKRKAEDEEGLDDGTGKKKTKAAKVTKGRIKGPIDLDKNCGVITDKGLPCFRALTCKSHSMGAKRAVEGRSKPFDDLVNELLKRNNPNYEPVKRISKAERKEKKEKEKAEKKRLAGEAAAAAAAAKAAAGGSAVKKGKKTAVGTVSGSGAASGAAILEDEDENMDDVDSEAELDAMVKAIRSAQAVGIIGKPLAIPSDAGTWFVPRRERLRNCKDLLASALASKNGLVNGPQRMSIS